MRYDCVLFDMDGTLLDSSKGIKSSVCHTIEVMGLPPLSDERLSRFIGPTLWDSFSKYCGLSGEALEQAVTLYREEYDKGPIFDAHVYDGIFDLLLHLREKKVKTSVATMKIERCMTPILERFGLAPLFDAACGTSPEISGGKKEVLLRSLEKLSCPDKKTAVLVGDSPLDAEGARDAGIDFIAAAYGFGFETRDEIQNYPHVFIADATSDLLSYLTE